MESSSMGEFRYQIPHQVLKQRAEETPDEFYLRQPIHRMYHEYSWGEVYDRACRLARFFKRSGYKQGDKIAILSKNVAEWFICDYAISIAGLVSVSVYPTANQDTISYILQHSEAKALIIGKLDDDEAIRAVLPNIDLLTISMIYTDIDCLHKLSDIFAVNRPVTAINEPSIDDIFSLVYTSGSTGHPKAAVVSYRNIAYAANATVTEAKLNNKDRLLSYLPLAHIAERSVIQYASVYSGAHVTFVESLDTFVEDIQDTQPSMFFSVPRLWLKFQSRVLSEMPQKKLNLLLKAPLLNRLVKKKIKTKLGLSRARIIGSGTAPIPTSTLEWFRSIGVDISEGWGMTETSGTAVMNYPYNAKKIGSIGRPVAGTEVKISDSGEILLKSEGMVSEYYKNEEKTLEAFQQGWLHTGDKGAIDPDGYITITGRVKDQFKSGKGKYVVPVPIESRLYQNQCIEQVCVMGSGLSQPVATVVINQELRGQSSQQELEKSLTDSLTEVNESLEAHEKLERIYVANEDWNVENNLLTPTLKIKRNELENKYRDAIEAESDEMIVWL